MLNADLDRLRNGHPIEMPIYSYVTCGRSKETITVNPSNVIIVEGILILTNAELRKRMDIMVFVDADHDDRLMRIVQRDMLERGRSLDDVLEHYTRYVKPMHLQFIEPTKRYANIIIPQGGKNHVGIDVIAHRIRGSL